MAYDIPDEIKYREKIVGPLDGKQLIYALFFAVLALILYRLPIVAQFKLVLPGIILLLGVGFVFLNLEEFLKDLFAFYFGFRKADYYQKAAQKFFEVRSVLNNVIYLEKSKMLAVLEVQPVNFKLMDEGRRISLISNYKSFLNQLTVPIQVLVRTRSVNLEGYFQKGKEKKIKDRFLLGLYSDFQIFEEELLSSQNIKERQYYLIIPFSQIKTILDEKGVSESQLFEDLINITQEKLSACGLETNRLGDRELTELLRTYGSSSDNHEEHSMTVFDFFLVRFSSLKDYLKTLSRYLPNHIWKINLSEASMRLPVLRYINDPVSASSKSHSLGRYAELNSMDLASLDIQSILKANYEEKIGLVANEVSNTEFTLSILILTKVEHIPLIFPGQTEKKTDINPEKIEEKTIEFRDEITPSFDMRRDYAFVNEELHRIVRVIGYPRKVDEGWLQIFLSKNENYDVSLHITPASIDDRLVYLHNQIIQQTSDLMMGATKGTPNPALEIKKADTLRVYDSIYKGEEKMFSVSIYLDNHAPTFPEIGLLTEKCKSNLNSQMMIPKLVEWRMGDAIKSTLPIAANQLGYGRDFLTNSLAATFPFISPSNTRKRGVLFAHEADTKNPIFLDFESMNNKHFFVIGISGSGKSYTSKYLLMQQLFYADTKVFILDPNGEYISLCKSLGGQVIELSRESKSTINIFDLAGADYGDKMLNLLSAFDIIVGGLTESQKGALNKILTKAYSEKGILHDDPNTWNNKMPTFSDIRNAALKVREELMGKKEFLFDSSVEALLNRLEMYCKGGIFGFLDQESKLDLKKGFICFDLSKLPNAVKTLLMFATLETIRQEICKDKLPKIALIDEGWSLLKSHEAASYILEFIKTSRKFNTSMGFVTQEMEDLLRSETGKSILNTASVKILMRQNPSNIDLIADTLKLNQIAKDYLLTAKNGHGLLLTEQNIYKFSVKASDKLHALITTKPLEVSGEGKEMAQIKAFDLKEGLYLKKDLSEDQQEYLLHKGYKPIKGRITKDGGSAWYLVKIRNTESEEHAFLCWIIYNQAKKRFANVEMNVSQCGDVVIDTGTSKIAFEVETGSNLERMDNEALENKFDQLYEDYDDFYIVVTDYDYQRRYSRYGRVILRNKIDEVLLQMAGT